MAICENYTIKSFPQLDLWTKEITFELVEMNYNFLILFFSKSKVTHDKNIFSSQVTYL